MVAYIWNQWLKMSSMSSARKPQYQRRFSMPKIASRPAVDSLGRTQLEDLHIMVRGANDNSMQVFTCNES